MFNEHLKPIMTEAKILATVSKSDEFEQLKVSTGLMLTFSDISLDSILSLILIEYLGYSFLHFL